MVCYCRIATKTRKRQTVRSQAHFLFDEMFDRNVVP